MAAADSSTDGSARFSAVLVRLPDGAVITVDGTTGRIYEGNLPSRRGVPAFVERALSLRDTAKHPDQLSRQTALSGLLTHGLPEMLLWLAVKAFRPLRGLDEHLRNSPEVRRDDLIEQTWLVEDTGVCHLTEEDDQPLIEFCRTRVEPGRRSDVEEFFASFARFDQELKAVAVEWQEARHGEDDPDRLMSIPERRFALDDELAALLATHPAAARVLNAQAPALRDTRRHFEAVQPDSFTGLADGSYHSLWFFTHELLLWALGKQRTE